MTGVCRKKVVSNLICLLIMPQGKDDQITSSAMNRVHPGAWTQGLLSMQIGDTVLSTQIVIHVFFSCVCGGGGGGGGDNGGSVGWSVLQL